MRNDTVKLVTAWFLGIALLMSILIFGITWAVNQGVPDQSQAKVTALCIAHSSAPVCQVTIQQAQMNKCRDLANSASRTAGAYAQNFTGQDWQSIYNRCRIGLDK